MHLRERSGSYVAYCFDQAVYHAGNTIQGLLDQVQIPNTGKTSEKMLQLAKQNLLERLLYGKVTKKGKYRDPALGREGKGGE